MASIRKTVQINVAAPAIWDAVRDVGNLHLRIAPGLVADCHLSDDGTERTVTFADGTILPETIITLSDETMRLVWSARNPSWTHHNGVMEVAAVTGEISSVTWSADVLPHDAADMISPLMEAGLATMKAHLERGGPSQPEAGVT